MEGILSPERVGEILRGMDAARVALIGDMCLDLYWRADMRLSELSRETPHFPLPIVEERFSPGGAGNVAANLAALRPGKLSVLGVVGDDWRGDLLRRALESAGVDASRLVKCGSVCTNAYIKPLRSGISGVVYEDPRIDFENRAPIPASVEGTLIDALAAVAEDCDVLLVSDQMRFGCVTEAVREKICALGRAGRTVIVDSRDRIGLYRDVIVKPNEVEAGRAFGGGEIPATEEAMAALAAAAAERTGKPAIVTAGPMGCFVSEGRQARRVPGAAVSGPVDIVGAGDTFLSALGCAVASGCGLRQAAAIANLAASVTIRKLGTTGTASREEVRAAADNC